MMERFFLACIILLLCSCSLGTQSSSEIDPRLARLPLEIDVFSARGFLGGSEYERYFLSRDFVWRECGDVSPASTPALRSLEGDEVFAKDPTLKIRERRVDNLSKEAEIEIKQRVNDLIDILQSSDVADPPPGPVFSLSDPGVFELSMKLGSRRHRLITSVDAVADKASRPLKEVHDLFSTLRGIGPTICDSPTFFGIARTEL